MQRRPRFQSLGWLVLASLVSTGTAPLQAAEQLFYRYAGSKGNVVIDDAIPPDAVPRGYDVIRADGSIVKTVPPQLTEDQKRARSQELAVAKARAEAEEKMREWDNSLFLRYSSVEDIDVAKQRALNDIKVRIAILESNLSVSRQQVTQSQSDAAEIERRGDKVPEALIDNMSLLRREISAIEEQIASRRQELLEVADNYDRDRARFSVLQKRINQRREFYHQSRQSGH